MRKKWLQKAWKRLCLCIEKHVQCQENGNREKGGHSRECLDFPPDLFCRCDTQWKPDDSNTSNIKDPFKPLASWSSSLSCLRFVKWMKTTTQLSNVIKAFPLCQDCQFLQPRGFGQPCLSSRTWEPNTTFQEQVADTLCQTFGRKNRSSVQWNRISDQFWTGEWEKLLPVFVGGFYRRGHYIVFLCPPFPRVSFMLWALIMANSDGLNGWVLCCIQSWQGKDNRIKMFSLAVRVLRWNFFYLSSLVLSFCGWQKGGRAEEMTFMLNLWFSMANTITMWRRPLKNSSERRLPWLSQ